MNKIKLLVTLIVISILFYLSFFIYKKLFSVEQKAPFKTEKPQKRSIYQIINSSGTLEIKDHIKIGSLVAGTVKEIFVAENDFVKKGQLLAEIDNGKDDTEVRMAQGELDAAKAEQQYQEKYFKRQEQLYKAGQLAKDNFEKISKDFQISLANVKTKKANLDNKTIEFDNTKIKSPVDGIIVSVGITQGMAITKDLDATVLFTIASDITQMEAYLDIDESDICLIKKNQKVKFTVGAYLDLIFRGTIADVGYAAQTKNNVLTYKATVDIKNKNKLLRPGMTINAKITSAKSINCLTVPMQAFQINQNILEKISSKINFKLIPIEPKKKKSFEKNNSAKTSTKYVWVAQNKSFIEKAIIVALTDNHYFEIKSGITETDEIIISIDEKDDMENLYQKIFKGSL